MTCSRVSKSRIASTYPAWPVISAMPKGQAVPSSMARVRKAKMGTSVLSSCTTVRASAARCSKVKSSMVCCLQGQGRLAAAAATFSRSTSASPRGGSARPLSESPYGKGGCEEGVI